MHYSVMPAQESYLNPVYPYSSPDPFVMKYLGEYWCYCTGRGADGRCFPVLHSTDLVNWIPEGTAMDPLAGSHTEYWAPEVNYWEGQFYLYYSVGDGWSMHVRVATSDSPGGPFVDSGRRLTSEEFAIDPHVFTDDDGRRWMFYATDFLQHTHIGTGTALDLLVDPVTLAGQPSAVCRARFDWQVFDPRREEKGGVRWHTVEGPSVLKHKRLYYQMFSGGNWRNASYGVSYAYTDEIDRQEDWTQVCDGEAVLPLLRTRPGAIGPGHNSVTRGPDNVQDYCIYHRWDEKGENRLMALDRLEFIGRKLVVFGPSVAAEPYPNTPKVREPVAFSSFSAQWQCTGDWLCDQGTVIQRDVQGRTRARLDLPVPAGMTLEVWLRAAAPACTGTFGVCLTGGDSSLVQIALNPSQARIELSFGAPAGLNGKLPHAFRAETYHLLRLDLSGRVLSASLDAGSSKLRTVLSGYPSGLALFTEAAAAQFAGFAVTRGWRDTFSDGPAELSELGWDGDIDSWDVEDMQLCKRNRVVSTIFKAAPFASYEYVVNVRLFDPAGENSYGFFPAATEMDEGPLLSLARSGNSWCVSLSGTASPETREARILDTLPSGFEPTDYEQFRFRVEGGALTVTWRARILGEVRIAQHAQRVGIYAKGAVAVDMVRLTELASSKEING